jgi:hypothetical protein
MSSTGQKWLYGCGISCGVIVLLSVLILGGCFLFLKNATESFEGIETSMDAVTEQYGEIGDYVPPADGVLSDERLEAFLSVRSMMASSREDLGGSITVLADGAGQLEEGSWKDKLLMLRSGMSMIPQLINYFGDFSEALLASGMGQGEYYYIYAVTYYSWLGFSPGDGPPFKLSDDDNVTISSTNDTEDIRQGRDEQLRRYLNRTLLPMLDGQLNQLDAAPAETVDPAWRELLAEEVAALDHDSLRLPWQDGLPEQLEVVLEPFHDRLVDSYDEMCNSVEILFQNR